MSKVTLGDLGERRIISEVLAARYRSTAPNFGDDCVSIPLSDGEVLVATTDPCPEPMAAALGFSDWYYRGWLLGTINLSDLAAAGARPLGLLAAYEIPPSTLVEDFQRLLVGLDECLQEHGTRVLGGNIKETGWISLSGTAIGIRQGAPAHRGAAVDGDAVYLFGQSGRFWASVLAYNNWPTEMEASPERLDAVLRPRPNLSSGIALASSGLVRSLTDNSDGLYTTLEAIALEASCGFDIDLKDSWVADSFARAVAVRLDLEPVRFALGWGDWQLIGMVDSANTAALEAFSSSKSIEAVRIGTVSTSPGVRAHRRGKSGRLLPLDSERFSPNSWMSVGLQSYIDLLCGGELIQDE